MKSPPKYGTTLSACVRQSTQPVTRTPPALAHHPLLPLHAYTSTLHPHTSTLHTHYPLTLAHSTPAPHAHTLGLRLMYSATGQLLKANCRWYEYTLEPCGTTGRSWAAAMATTRLAYKTKATHSISPADLPSPPLCLQYVCRAHFSDPSHPGDVGLKDVRTASFYQLTEAVSMATAYRPVLTTGFCFPCPALLSPCPALLSPCPALLPPCPAVHLVYSCSPVVRRTCPPRALCTSLYPADSGRLCTQQAPRHKDCTGLTLIVVGRQTLFHPLQVQGPQ